MVLLSQSQDSGVLFSQFDPLLLKPFGIEEGPAKSMAPSCRPASTSRDSLSACAGVTAPALCGGTLAKKPETNSAMSQAKLKSRQE